MTPYEVGIHLSATNSVSGVLAVISKDLLGLNMGVEKLEKGFARLNQVLIGAAAIGGAVKLIDVYRDVAEHGKELLNRQEQLVRVGISLAEVNRMTAASFREVAKAVPTATAAEHLKTILELRGVVGDTGLAEKMAPKALKASALLENVVGGEQGSAFWNLLRTGEMKGIATSPDRLNAFVDAAMPWFLAQGGKFGPAQFVNFARRAGASWISADMAKSIPSIMVASEALGGPTAGQSMMSLYQLMMGTMTLSKQQGEAFKSLGMIDMSKTKATGFGGSKLQLEPGAIKGSLAHSGDLPGWVREVLWPRLEKMTGGDDARMQALIAKIAPNRNAARMLYMFGSPDFRDQIAKDIGIVTQHKSFDESYKQFAEKNPLGVEKAFGAQWESMLSAIGAPLMQAAIPVMKDITAIFTKIGEFANQHPDAIANIGKGIAALGVALAVGGTVTIAGALLGLGGAIAGIPIATIAGATAALGALGFLFKNELGEAFIAAVKAFGDSVTWLAEKIGAAFQWIGGLVEKFGLGKIGYEGGGDFGGARVWNASYGGSGGSFSGDTGGIPLSGGAAARGSAYALGGMNPDFRARLGAMIADANASGHKLSVMSGFRSQAHQNSLFAKSDGSGHWVARHSRHTMGLAADLQGDLAWAHKNADRYGLHFPMPWERWHVEPKGSRGGAKEQHIHLHLNGREIHKEVVRETISASLFPTRAPYHDGGSTWTPPDAGLVAV